MHRLQVKRGWGYNLKIEAVYQFNPEEIGCEETMIRTISNNILKVYSDKVDEFHESILLERRTLHELSKMVYDELKKLDFAEELYRVCVWDTDDVCVKYYDKRDSPHG